MALGTRRTPERHGQLLSGLVLQKFVPTVITLTTGGGVRTLTAAEMQQGMLPLNCDDAQTLKVPTATDLNAGIPGVAVGTAIYLDIINYGDATATLAINTGVTNFTPVTVVSVLTMATLTARRILMICTGVNGQDGATSDSWNLYSFGITAAAAA